MIPVLRFYKYTNYLTRITRGFSKLNVEHKLNISRSNFLLQRALTSQAPLSIEYNRSLEKSLKRLDIDVRRTGRISRRDLEEVLQEIKQTKFASSSQALLIIRCCGSLVPEEPSEIRTEIVHEILNLFNKLKIPLDISHYNALLRVYLENEYNFSPTEFLADLQNKGIEPNRVTYQRLITRYCLAGDIEGATTILEYMKDKQLPVNEQMFNALILGHSKSGDMESAEGILNVMKQAGIEPSSETYTQLLCGYATNGQLDKLNDQLKNIEQKEIELNDRELMDVVYELALNDHYEVIPKFLDKMPKAIGYNQEAVNLILKLLNKGKDSVAFQVFKTMQRQDNQPGNYGTFFIRHLVKINRPAENIIKICHQMEQEGLNQRALYIASDLAIQQNNPDLIYPLLKEMKKNGLPVRPHYFWPLIVNEKSAKGVYNILNVIHNDFELLLSGDSLQDFVIPKLLEFNERPEQILDNLQNYGVSIGSAAFNLVCSLLNKGNIKEAANICQRYNAFYSPYLIRPSLVQAYLRTNDNESLIRIIRGIQNNLYRKQAVSNATDEHKKDDMLQQDQEQSNSFAGAILGDIAIQTKNVDLVQNLVETFINAGLSITDKSAERLQDILGSKLTTEISNQLKKLTSGELTPVQFEGDNVDIPRSKAPSANNLERIIKMVREKGENTSGLQRQLLTIYCRNKEKDKVEKLLAELPTDFEFNSGIYAQLIELYASVDDIIKTKEYLEKLKQHDPQMALDDLKTIKVVDLLLRNQQFDEATEFLNQQSRERKKPDDRTFNYNQSVWKCLNHLAEIGKVDELNRLFNILMEKDYMTISNVLLGPLIKVYLVNNDLPKALEKFEELAKKYQVTPWKNELTRKLILTEDAENLQKITDISTEIHGEVNSLYDLVFSFIECGKIRQARKILETPGLRNRQNKVDTFCEMKCQDGEAVTLEGLVEATRDLSYIDRSNIFYHLLKMYIKDKNPEKALGLWTRMQEEDVQPNDKFLYDLGTFLKSENLKVPFEIPHLDNKKTEKDLENGKIEREERTSPNLTQMRIALRTDDLEKALKIKETLSVMKLTINDYSTLIEKLLQKDRLNEAKNLLFEMIQQNNDKDRAFLPRSNILKFALSKMAKSGDIDAIKQIGEKLNDTIKRFVSFDNKLCVAYSMAGKSREIIEQIECEIDSCKTDDDLNKIMDKFPRGGLLEILKREPNLLPDFERITLKYADKGFLTPINVLWIHFLINDQHQKANEIFEKYLKNSSRLMFQRIVTTAIENRNEDLARNLISCLKHTKINEMAKGAAYNCLLEILSRDNRVDECLDELKQINNEIGIEFLSRNILIKIQDLAISSGKSFPYTIVSRKSTKLSSSTIDGDDDSSNSSSSSSSDDDLDAKVVVKH